MGRTLPSITQAFLHEQQSLARFRRALRLEDQRALDDLLGASRQPPGGSRLRLPPAAVRGDAAGDAGRGAQAGAAAARRIGCPAQAAHAAPAAHLALPAAGDGKPRPKDSLHERRRGGAGPTTLFGWLFDVYPAGEEACASG